MKNLFLFTIAIFMCSFINAQKIEKTQSGTTTKGVATSQITYTGEGPVEEYVVKHVKRSSAFICESEIPLARRQRHNRNSIYRGTGKVGCKFIYLDENGNEIESMTSQNMRIAIDPNKKNSIIVLNAPKDYQVDDANISQYGGNGLHKKRPSKKQQF